MLQFPSNIALNKNEIRKLCKQKRDELYFSGECDRISKLITDRILKLDDFLCAKNVMLFHPLKKEINLLGLLSANDKNFYFPKCSAKNMFACPINNNDDTCFTKGAFGIMEPKTSAVDDVSIIDIVIAPALCVDMSLNRLGYGGGFYDRFFANENLRAKKIAVIAQQLITEKLPFEIYDIPVDYALCENGLITRE